MGLDGCCFLAPDEPNEGYPHFIIVMLTINDKALIVPISSIKFGATYGYKYDGKSCKYYDDACTLDMSDIVDDNGKYILKKPSFVRYQWAKEVTASSILKKRLKSIYSFKCRISQALLTRIRDGAKRSKELKRGFKEYFE
jgi:hypothetical protein